MHPEAGAAINQPSASAHTPKEIVLAFAQAVNQRDWQAIDRWVSATFVRHSAAAPPVRNLDELKACLRNEFETFPDAIESIEDIFSEGPKVAVRHRFRGTQTGPMGPYPPSGKVMTADYIAIYRVDGRQIVEAWVEWDNLSGLAQLGHYPPGVSPSR